jgi:hypothetical protein
MADIVESVLWRSIPWPGHEVARVVAPPDGWLLEGGVAFAQEGQSCLLNYAIRCTNDWVTRHTLVSGWVGSRPVEVTIEVSDDRVWRLNGEVAAAVAGCIDIDLNFSPSTNLLPIRRLDLQVGQEASVRAAWLRFPSFRLEPLAQSYTRRDEMTYVYRNQDSGFTADLRVSPHGLVLDYEGLWTAEPLAPSAP